MLGFTRDSFLSTASCEPGLVTSLFPVGASQNYLDQFAAFRSNTINQLFSQCVLLGTKTSITKGVLGARLGFTCAGQTTSFIFARVPVEDFFLRLLSGDPKYLVRFSLLRAS
jgi:hypothetical protein